MENLLIKTTNTVPGMDFNAETGVLIIKGRSLPENYSQAFTPAFSWIEEYAKNPRPKTIVKVLLDYFNTISSKMLFDLFNKISEIKSADHEVMVYWFYEEDDVDQKEEGEKFSANVDLDIAFIEVEEFDFDFS